MALSGESLSIHGNPLKRFKVAQLGTISISGTCESPEGSRWSYGGDARSDAKAFSPSNQTMLEAVADYASISLMNVRLFDALEKEHVHCKKQSKTQKKAIG